ncbi:MAG: phenylalanine--tRNA ligase alpha subunit [Candidatus Binatia bacterium]|nr:MAG: phenylalanine--tRNA ligase alpha subunit [Candidatus Binatia bacterium]
MPFGTIVPHGRPLGLRYGGVCPVMMERLESLYQEALAALRQARSSSEVEQLRVRYLGRNGELTQLVRSLRDVPPEDRPRVGARLNAIKDALEAEIGAQLTRLQSEEEEERLARERVDVTVPGRRRVLGALHPITQTIEEIVDIFVALGFEVATGPDIEDDYHNFTALNFPPDHPARDMQDTFFVDEDYLLRTHTSPVQIRVMESRQPPLRVVVPGATYRHDDDLTHSPMFHQIEGFLVDERVSMADLKGVLTYAMRELFGPETRLRFRASFFPFTEPSAEVDIACVMCGGRDRSCRVCKGSGWLEILGAGLIDPNVFAHVGYDPEKVSGFAFGLGVERVAMLKYEIPDIRTFTTNDVRFLRQFV